MFTWNKCNEIMKCEITNHSAFSWTFRVVWLKSLMNILLTKISKQIINNREIIDVHHVKNSIWHNLFHFNDQSLRLQSHSNSLINNQTYFSLFARNVLNEIDISRNIEIFERLYELELSRKSKHQTIYFRIRF